MSSRLIDEIVMCAGWRTDVRDSQIELGGIGGGMADDTLKNCIKIKLFLRSANHRLRFDVC
jgi:hypothetical protein